MDAKKNMQICRLHALLGARIGEVERLILRTRFYDAIMEG
jgi:hypothetical protein